MSVPEYFNNVKVPTKANIYFDGKVVSHTLLSPDGRKTTLGLIYPGSYLFNTGAPEKMILVSGDADVRLKGSETWKPFEAGQAFDVDGNSSFEIRVEEGVTEYICEFK